MTIRKTGGLFMLAIRLMQLFSDNKNNFSKLTAVLGLYFQIRDDYCNLIDKEVCVCVCLFSYASSLGVINNFLSPFSIRRTRAFARIWQRENSVFPSFMPYRFRNRIVKYCVSFFVLLFLYYIYLNALFTDILRQRTRDIEVKKYCINLLEKLGSFKYTRDILQSLDREARAEVHLLLLFSFVWTQQILMNILIAGCPVGS